MNIGLVLAPRIALQQHCKTCGRVLDGERQDKNRQLIALFGVMGRLCKCLQAYHPKVVSDNTACLYSACYYCHDKEHWVTIDPEGPQL